MYRILIFLIVSMLWCGAVVAAEDADTLLASDDSYWQKLDATTEWGKWLLSDVKPYWDKMSEAALLTQPPADMDTNLPPEEMVKKVSVGYQKCHEAMQKIAAPDDLKAYHAKVLELYAAIAQNVTASPEEAFEQGKILDKLGNESNQELVKAFTQRGVPENVIREFTGAPEEAQPEGE